MVALVATWWGKAKSIWQCLPKHFVQMVTVLLAAQEKMPQPYQIDVVQSLLLSTVTILNLNFAGHVSPFLADICSDRCSAASASAPVANNVARSLRKSRSGDGSLACPYDRASVVLSRPDFASSRMIFPMMLVIAFPKQTQLKKQCQPSPLKQRQCGQQGRPT